MAEYGIPNLTGDIDAALADPEVNAVFICSSTNTHADCIVKAAVAGKHIFCEKPLDSDVPRLLKALDVVKEKNVLFQTGFMRRYDRNHGLVRKTLDSGRIGSPQMIRLSCRDTLLSPYEYLKVSGGIFFDMMIHDFDMVRFLSKSEVVSVYATGEVFTDPRLKDIPDVDTAVAVLKLANGVIAVVDSGRQAFYGHDQRSEVYCSKGTIQVMNETENTVVVSDADGIHCPKPLDFWLERYGQAYVTQDNGFVESVLDGKPIAVTAHDGVQPILIAKAAQMSWEQNRPVMISEVLA